MSGILIKTLSIRIGTDSLYLNSFQASLDFGFTIECYDKVAENLEMREVSALTRACLLTTPFFFFLGVF